MKDLPLVAVAMSGGVDSSVAAALLKEQGYPVIGLMLRLWSEPGKEDDNKCCTPDAMMQARRVAARLGFPFYVLDCRDYFYKTVVGAFLEGYRSGITPNPCLICNQKVRWGYLLEQARAFGADLLATGHYVQIRRGENGKCQLLRAKDESKDQSYVLSRLNQDQLAHSLFPLGEYRKSEVRQIAQRFHLEVATREESQDLCFLGRGDYRDFFNRNANSDLTPGKIVNREGKTLGVHQGLVNYTIGQRKGLCIAAERPLYVLEMDLKNNLLVVGFAEDLSFTELTASEANWISGEAPDKEFEALVKIRYKAKYADAMIIPQSTNQFRAIFKEPLRDITPGQAAVIYDNEVVLGSGIILSVNEPGE